MQNESKITELSVNDLIAQYRDQCRKRQYRDAKATREILKAFGVDMNLDESEFSEQNFHKAVKDRAAKIYTAIMAAEWSFDTTSEKLVSVAINAAIVFESRVHSEIEEIMATMGVVGYEPEDSVKSETNEITLSMKLPAKVRAIRDNRYYCGKNFLPFGFRKGFTGHVLEVKPEIKSILLAFGTEKDWFPIDMVKKDFELCESQS